MKKYLILFVSIFLMLFIVSCNLNNKHYYPKISADQVKRELDTILLNLEEAHPNPYANISKENLLRKINDVKNSIRDSINLVDYYLKVSPVLSALNDGHTGVKFPFDVFKKVNSEVFPIKIELDKRNRLIVMENFEEVPKYSQILRVNNTDVNEIVQLLFSLISAEEDGYKKLHINNSINILLSALFEFTEEYEVTYIFDNKEYSRKISSDKFSSFLSYLKKQGSNSKFSKSSKNYTFEILNDNTIGYIDFRSFWGIKAFDSFLDSTFTIIKERKINNLIIDLRENGGGNSELGDALFQYISKVPFKQFGKTTIKYSLQREIFYKSNRNTWFSDISDSTFNRFFLHQVGETIIENDTNLIDLKENSLRYQGDVYLLTSIETFSSATDFAWTFKKFKMGEIIGEKTGGHIVAFGDILVLTLPYSKLGMYLSHKEFYGYGASDKERHSVYPDYKVDSEEALDYTINLIKNSK